VIVPLDAVEVPWVAEVETNVTPDVGSRLVSMTFDAATAPVFVTVNRNVRSLPTVGDTGFAVPTTLRLIPATTEEVTVAELFVGVVSSVAVTVPVLERLVGGVVVVATTVTVTVAVSPAANDPRVPVITLLDRVIVPCVATACTNDVPAGSVSRNVTLDAVFGPVLLIVNVYVRKPPAATGFGDPVPVMDTSETTGAFWTLLENADVSPVVLVAVEETYWFTATAV
jgi:hypothetical protein